VGRSDEPRRIGVEGRHEIPNAECLKKGSKGKVQNTKKRKEPNQTAISRIKTKEGGMKRKTYYKKNREEQRVQEKRSEDYLVLSFVDVHERPSFKGRNECKVSEGSEE